MTLKWAVILNDPEFDDALIGGGVESEDGIFFSVIAQYFGLDYEWRHARGKCPYQYRPGGSTPENGQTCGLRVPGLINF